MTKLNGASCVAHAGEDDSNHDKINMKGYEKC